MNSNADLMVRLLLNTEGFDRNIQLSTQQIRNFQGSVDTMSKGISSFGQGLGINIGQLTKFGTVAGAAAAAGKVLSDAFITCEANVDRFQSTIEQAKGGYEAFLTTLRSGDWGNLIENIKSATEAAEEYYAAIDAIGTYDMSSLVDFSKIDRDRAKNKLDLKKGLITEEEYNKREEDIAKREQEVIKLGKDIYDRGSSASLDKALAGYSAKDWEDYSRKDELNLPSFPRYIFKFNKVTAGLSDISNEDFKKVVKNIIEKIDNGGIKEFDPFTNSNKVLNESFGVLAQQYFERQRAFYEKNTLEAGEQFYRMNNNFDRWDKKEFGKAYDKLRKYIKDQGTMAAAYDFLLNPDNFEAFKEAYQNKQKGYQLEAQGYRNQLRAFKDKPKHTTKPSTPAPPPQIEVDPNTLITKYQPIIEDLSSKMPPIDLKFDIDIDWTKANLLRDIMELTEELENTTYIANNVANALGAVGNAFRAAGEDGAAFALNTMSQISQLIAQIANLVVVDSLTGAAKLPFPANIAAITATVATVASIVAGAMQTFADGGIVQGAGSGWSDSIPTLLSNGEMVLNRRQQGNLFALLDGSRVSDSTPSGGVEFKIKGTELVGVLKNYNKKTSKVL